MNKETIIENLAKDETPIQATQLLSEIYPLLEDYFEGEISFDGQEISYRLPNGQHFRVSAQAS